MQNYSLSWTEVFSITASIVSIILGGFAIWLSIMFYRLSNESSAKIKESADRIGSSVDRLEVLFNKLYADTFSMMRDTVSDMRKHIWRDDTDSATQISEEAEKRADEKIGVIRTQLQQEVSQLVNRQSSTDERVTKLGEEIKSLVSRAITESRKAEVEALEETIRVNILQAFKLVQALESKITVNALNDVLRGKFTKSQISRELFRMAREGIVTWVGFPDRILYDDEIKLLKS